MRRFFCLRAPQLRYPQSAAPFEELPLSDRMVLMWKHRCVTDVVPEKGSLIKTGQNLARIRTDAFISPATGRVESVADFHGHDGDNHVAIEISTRSDDDYDRSLTVYDEFLDIDPGELLSVIFFMGFTEFAPLLQDASGRVIPETLIISAMDRDPSSLVNQQILREHLGDLERSITLAAHATQAKRVILAVPAHLDSEIPIKDIAGVSLVRVAPVYPNGLPELLALRHGSGPLIDLPSQGAGKTLVIDLEHAIEMLNCVESGKPLTHKRVTFVDSESGRVTNVRVRIGTPIQDILSHLGKDPHLGGKLIVNGYLRGYSCFSTEQPITHESESLTLQPPNDVHTFSSSACINCGSCTAVCPTHLQVHLLGRYSEYGFFNKCADLGVAQCVECGLCSYVCPARRSLVQLMAQAKQSIRNLQESEPSLKEIMACNACGPSCPAIRLFDLQAPDDHEEKP